MHDHAFCTHWICLGLIITGRKEYGHLEKIKYASTKLSYLFKV